MTEENAMRLMILGLGSFLGFALGWGLQSSKEDPTWSELELDLLREISTHSLCEELAEREGTWVKIDGEWQVDMEHLSHSMTDAGRREEMEKSLLCLRAHDPWEFERLASALSGEQTD